MFDDRYESGDLETTLNSLLNNLKKKQKEMIKWIKSKEEVPNG